MVAYDKQRGIGATNDLLWKRELPADLRHFREITLGGTVIMGRKTYESIGRPLPNRQNIVVSRSKTTIAGVTVVQNLAEAYAASHYEIYIIGGGSIYTAAFGDVDAIYATEVDAEFSQATIFFPALAMANWQEITRQHHDADCNNTYAYDFVTYKRR